jgi:hypothetical protein
MDYLGTKYIIGLDTRVHRTELGTNVRHIQSRGVMLVRLTLGSHRGREASKITGYNKGL